MPITIPRHQIDNIQKINKYLNIDRRHLHQCTFDMAKNVTSVKVKVSLVLKVSMII